ncbi:hypothetical protein K7I13_10985 [Brucepastera parasyntrophica]|uniref:secretin N-terminal domain-containing protein n=1 Tax=Brucepastera parasyntrophica TaxID=2880008 RepID=UPI00210B7275|nr:secretin N-terminal domain-containing protein [Brucepastera parasyntrophica]ULQ59032.1 hypothetical protein K7I13_10985 [Brucepastera parasyntrophica]
MRKHISRILFSGTEKSSDIKRHYEKKYIAVLLLAGTLALLFAQTATEEKISLDFRNQKISDILLALAEISNKSIIMDETISGNATFRFADSDFDSALMRFAEYCNLFVIKKDSDYHVSRISIQLTVDGLISIDAEEVIPELIVKKLSQNAKKTILYDSLPSEKMIIRTQDATLEEVLRLILIKYPEYNLVSQSGGFYIKRDPAQLNESRAAGDVRIDTADDFYSVSSRRVAFNTLIDTLFKKANKEYLILNRSTAILENIYYENKTFESLLRLLLDSVNYDYKVENGVYYIFEIQRRDIVKKLKENVTVRLTHISAAEVQNMLPSELNASGFIKIDRNSNSVFVTGSEEEINPILAFLQSIDIPLEGRYYKMFTVNNIGIADAVSILPKSLLFFDPVIIPKTASFVTQVDSSSEEQIAAYLSMIDKKNLSYPIRLRYIKSEELLKYLPPSAVRENLAVTGDTSLVFLPELKTRIIIF